jgi:ABC-type branched-subunit amino acid transport system substrate-binding protein
MGTRRQRLAVALLAAVTLALGACGNEGDDDDTGSDASGGTEQTDAGSDTTTGAEDPFADLERIEEPDPCELDPGVTDTEIKVGVIAIQSGPQATSFGPAVDGIKARIAKANEEGELGERTITLVERDDTADQTRNSEVARDLVEQENVFGIIETSSASAGSAPYLNEQGVPVAGWHVGVPDWSKNVNMFTFRQGTADDPEHEYNTRNVELFKEFGATKLALIGGQNQSSALFIERVRKTVEQVGGLEVVYENTGVPVDQRDFTSEVQAIQSSGADGLLTGMDFLQNAAISEGLNTAGVEMKVVVFPGGYDPRIVSLPGVEGAVFGLEFKPFELETPSFQEFDKWAPDSVVRGQVPYIGWLSAEMFLEGLKQAGLNCPTREAFIANLRLVDDYSANGAFDPVDLSEGFGDEFLCVYYVQVEGGAFVPLFDGEQFCGEPVQF